MGVCSQRAHFVSAKDALWPVKGPPFPITGSAAIKKSEFYPRRLWQEGTGEKKEAGKNNSAILSGCRVWAKAFCNVWELQFAILSRKTLPESAKDFSSF